MTTFERIMQNLLVIIVANIATIFSVMVGEMIDSSMHWQLPAWIRWALPPSVWLFSVVAGKFILTVQAKDRIKNGANPRWTGPRLP